MAQRAPSALGCSPSIASWSIQSWCTGRILVIIMGAGCQVFPSGPQKRYIDASTQDGAMKRIFRPFGQMLSTNAGFFGWILLSNMICLGMIYPAYQANKSFDDLVFGIGAVIWFVLIATVVFLIIRKKILLYSGIMIAVVLNGIIWVTMLLPRIELTMNQALMIPILPLPAGLLVLFSYLPA
jgi:hypothetical protein